MGTRFKPRVNSGSVFLTTRLELLVSRNGLKSLSWQCWAGSPDSGTVTTILTCLVMAERAFTKHCQTGLNRTFSVGRQKEEEGRRKGYLGPWELGLQGRGRNRIRGVQSHIACALVVTGLGGGWGTGTDTTQAGRALLPTRPFLGNISG